VIKERKSILLFDIHAKIQYFCKEIKGNFKFPLYIIMSSLQIREQKRYFTLKKIKHIINGIIWTLLVGYISLVVLMHMPPIQHFLGTEVATALAKKFGTKVSVGSIDLGFFNRLIIDDIQMYDQRGDSLLYASRISTKINIIPLLNNKISVASAQLFGLKANLYQQTAISKPNYQFVLDSLASKDTTQHTPIDLHIGSIIIRHGSIKYNKRYIKEDPDLFSTSHINISNLSTHIILNHITDNSIDLNIKKLELQDKSKLQLSSLAFKLKANKQEAILKDFELQLPNSDITLGDIHANYQMKNGKLDTSSLTYKGSIEQSKITLSDIACLIPMFNHFDDAIFFSSKFIGSANSIHCMDTNFRTGSGSINLQAKGSVSNWNNKDKMKWNAHIDNLNVTEESIRFISDNLGKQINIPMEVKRLGNIHYIGNIHGWGKNISSKGKLETDAGDANIELEKAGETMYAFIDTKGILLNKILANKNFGEIAATLDVKGNKKHLVVKGEINKFGYNRYNYRNIKLDGIYSHGLVKGTASINDPNIKVKIEGDYATRLKKYALEAYIQHFLPSIIGIKANDKTYSLDNITISTNNKDKDSYIDIEAPFADLHTRGQYDITNLYANIQNMIADKLPTFPGIKKSKVKANNDFTLQGNIYSVEPLNRMLGIPLTISSPIHINGNISGLSKEINMLVKAPLFSYNGKTFHNANIELMTHNNCLQLNACLSQGLPYEKAPSYQINAMAANNELSTLIQYTNNSKKLPIHGTLDAITKFTKNTQGIPYIVTKVKPSNVMLGDTKWDVAASTISYSKNNLAIDNFTVRHGNQHIFISGKATPNKEDSIVADIKDVDVAYILDLINFHSVNFAGKATGKAVVKSIFHDPDAYAKLDINDFLFEEGPLGILHALVNYDKEKEQIDIKATAEEQSNKRTYIDGYVSPKRNYIDLGITADGTNMKFLESFCGSFMDNIQAQARGKINVVGDLKEINLVGDIEVSGKIHMKQLGTDYHFDCLKAHAIPDDILLENDTIYDRNKHIAIVKGGIHHKHLTKLSYDLNLKAYNFLGYDTHEFGDNTFYGTVYATGDVGIHGKSGETIIDIDATPEPGSIFVYNVASPEAIGDKSFIHWHDITPDWEKPFFQETAKESKDNDNDIISDMKINFLVNTNPNLTLKLLMDEQSGDYITLNGNGVIRANYFNKGAFDMFGNYIVDHGVYKLTIQNIIKKDFEFMPGGTINFGGNPYNAPINLQAKYIVNGVPLSDLNIGQSFSSNNIRVDCLMNIQGTPSSPKVDFSMDLPTVNSDAKQMIYSIINSQEEMNQQVLYLLGIGRFYAQTKNNQASEDAAQQSQTSLAMQSLLSGTISQQINTVLSNLVKSKEWNFGANISTGDEGFNNAEYEGIFSGRLFNNRLLFNGQFGYRDNANATQSFIGDFDLRYLIFPNGNLSIRMYNQTNDRYFTKNSLNTQGIGLIMKKDFNGIHDLFGIKKKKRKTAK